MQCSRDSQQRPALLLVEDCQPAQKEQASARYGPIRRRQILQVLLQGASPSTLSGCLARLC